MGNLAHLSAGIGAGIALIGAGLGIGKLAAAALESAGRQPEAHNKLLIMMLIAGALIEGAAFFALFICFMLISAK